MTIVDRIKELRHAEQLSQAKFAERISISAGYIAGIEIGSRKVNDRLIRLICSEFCVNESWLRDGAGEMYLDNARDEEVFRFFGEAFNGDDGFKKSFLTALAKMKPEEWELVERFMRSVVEDRESGG